MYASSTLIPAVQLHAWVFSLGTEIFFFFTFILIPSKQKNSWKEKATFILSESAYTQLHQNIRCWHFKASPLAPVLNLTWKNWGSPKWPLQPEIMHRGSFLSLPLPKEPSWRIPKKTAWSKSPFLYCPPYFVLRYKLCLSVNNTIHNSTWYWIMPKLQPDICLTSVRQNKPGFSQDTRFKWRALATWANGEGCIQLRTARSLCAAVTLEPAVTQKLVFATH